MGILVWTWLVVVATFALYVVIALYTRATATGDFYGAEKTVHPVLTGMASGSEWISAASFISLAGLISLLGRDGSMYLMGWTGGYVLLAVLLAPYLRKYGKFTLPQFVGDRYYSRGARTVALACALLVSFVYLGAQMRGVGVVLSRFLDVSVGTGVWVGMGVVFCQAVLGGKKDITYAQVAQYAVLLAAYLVPAVLLSLQLTGQPLPALGYGSALSAAGAERLGAPAGQPLLAALDGLHAQLGFWRYSEGGRPTLDVLFVTCALMMGTAGLPHVVTRFFTVPRVRDARSSAGWALLFVALLYTAVPAMAAFARAYFVTTLHERPYAEAPAWFKHWEKTGLVGWSDHNGDGRMQYAAEAAANELRVDSDVLVLASPEMAGLPPWVVALLVAGALTAVLPAAAGLLLVIASTVSHDLMKGVLRPRLSQRSELRWARAAAAGAILLAGYCGVHPPGVVAEVVAYAFGLAAASFFPTLLLGIFWKRATREGAILGMLTGLLFTAGYIAYFTLLAPARNSPQHWWLGISPEGIGTLGMLLHVAVLTGVSLLTRAPPREVQELVAGLRYPKEAAPLPPARAAAASGSRR